MKKRELLASTSTPDGAKMELLQHAGDYYIEVDGQGLMSTRAPGSERALGQLAAHALRDLDRPRVLVAGLGLGFTLAAALETLPESASVVVVEFFETIVQWNRKFDFQGSEPLADPRVRVVIDDVVDFVRAIRSPFDAILLDVDNGPDAWCLTSNRRLYDPTGLNRLQRALKPGGLLAIWSAQASPPFVRRLNEAGYIASAETVRSRGHKGDRHTIFLARNGGDR